MFLILVVFADDLCTLSLRNLPSSIKKEDIELFMGK